MMKDIIILTFDLLIALVVIGLALYGEYYLLYPIMKKGYTEWLILILILSFFGLAWLNGKIIKILLPNFGHIKNPNYKGNEGEDRSDEKA